MRTSPADRREPCGRVDKTLDNAHALPVALPTLSHLSPTHSTESAVSRSKERPDDRLAPNTTTPVHLHCYTLFPMMTAGSRATGPEPFHRMRGGR